MQNTKDVGYNSKIKMTIAKYYIPSGRCIQSVSYKDGKKIELPDSLRAAFKTRNGRTVYDGGGVLPDVLIDKDDNSQIVSSLRKKHLMFKYVSKYYKQLESKCDSNNCDFEDFDHFKQYLVDEEFIHEGSSAHALNKLIAKAKKEKTYDAIKGQVNQINDALSSMQSELIEASKEDIMNFISQDLAGRKFFAKGLKKQALKGDADILRAVSILKDKSQYNEILKN